jgi:hypothetical protein
MPDGPKSPAAFGVDHYRPKGRPEFASMATLYDNLFYSCNCCNSRKGKHWPTDEQWKKGEFIPNPCDHVMFQHLRYNGANVETRSSAGKHADKILMLNDEDSVKYREFVLDGIHMAELQKRQAQQALIELDGMISTNPSGVLDGLKRTAEENLARAENVLKHLGAA